MISRICCIIISSYILYFIISLNCLIILYFIQYQYKKDKCFILIVELNLVIQLKCCMFSSVTYIFSFFAVPAYYALILRSLTVLEGLALYADPNFKVLAASYPYFAKRLLTDPNPYLRDALVELLFKDGKFRHVPFHYLNSELFL